MKGVSVGGMINFLFQCLNLTRSQPVSHGIIVKPQCIVVTIWKFDLFDQVRSTIVQPPCCGVSAVAAVAKEIKLESPPGGSMGKSIAAKTGKPSGKFGFWTWNFSGLADFPSIWTCRVCWKSNGHGGFMWIFHSECFWESCTLSDPALLTDTSVLFSSATAAVAVLDRQGCWTATIGVSIQNHSKALKSVEQNIYEGCVHTWNMSSTHSIWLVVATPLKNMKTNGKDYPIYYGK